MKTTRLRADVSCPWCAHVADAATSASGTRRHAPKPGDWAVCINCAKVGVYEFSPRARLRKPTMSEALEILRDPDIGRAKAAIIRASRDPVKGWDLPS